MNNVLVTGGSGAFGQAFVRRLLATTDIPRIAVYSRGEHEQEMMRLELDPTQDRLRFLIGDVRDYRRLTMAMRGVDTVVHAAALKVVPVVEYNPIEGLKTNAYGAANIIEAAIAAGVERVVGLSTDKAAAPVNAYGALKLAAEKMFLAANAYGGYSTRFCCTRYGNVSGSTGSVLPIWSERVRAGQPLLVTDPEMTRFQMTLDEAVDLVLRAIGETRGGEVFIPRLPSYRLGDLADALAPGWPIEVTGIRPGEKRHETLISEHESAFAWEHPSGYVLLGPDVVVTEGYVQVPDDFEYTSATAERMAPEALSAMVEPWRVERERAA